LQAVSRSWSHVWPSELDLMARIAGMKLRERWGDWKRAPFTAESTKHVSVWEKPAQACLPVVIRHPSSVRLSPTLKEQCHG
jgi:hypothetical protein